MKGYSSTLEYLYGLEKLGITFGTDSIRWILSLLDNPQCSFKTVHIGGTNGKGSVACMVSSVLRREGYRTGAYTSPHLVSFTERITVNGKEIREEEVAELTDFIKRKIDETGDDRAFTFFDFTTALAFEYFKRQGVEIAVIEVGLGGRLDSTNVITPLVSVITNVDLDHQDYLGNTIEEIAREKAGILKDRVPAVTGAKGKALEVIRSAAAKKTNLYVLDETFTYRKKGEQIMSYSGIRLQLEDIAIGLKGDHQLLNAALALCVLELLGSAGLTLRESAVREGLSLAEWPGRLEFIAGGCGKPDILLDGAHNPNGAKALAGYLKTHVEKRRIIMIFGVMKDKDFVEMLEELLPLVDRTILTRTQTDRAASSNDLAPYAPGAVVTETVEEALECAFGAADSGSLVLITGSLYTVGEAKRVLEKSA